MVSRASGFCAIGIRQISVAKQCNGRVLTDQIRLQKIPNLKALFPKVSSGILQWRRDMSSAASLLQGQGSHGTTAPVRLPLRSIEAPGRASAARCWPCNGVSYVLIDARCCWSIATPAPSRSSFRRPISLSGIGLVSVFVVLSEARLQRPVRRPLSDDLRRSPATSRSSSAFCWRRPQIGICLPQRRIPHVRIRRAANDLAAGDRSPGRSP